MPALPAGALIGMVHLCALPGTAAAKLGIREMEARARHEARVLCDAGFDALLVENMHDTPYLRRSVGPEITAAMAVLTRAVVEESGLPVGVQVLAGANREAIAVALASGASFIRAEGFVFGHVADEGWMDSDAGELLRYRRAIGASAVQVFVDIKKKHSSHAVTADVSLRDTAEAAEFFRADGVVVTGSATGKPTAPGDLQEARSGCRLPILVGSGVTPENLPALWPLADGFIVGSWMKSGGRWDNPVDPARAALMVEAARRLPPQAPPGREPGARA